MKRHLALKYLKADKYDEVKTQMEREEEWRVTLASVATLDVPWFEGSGKSLVRFLWDIEVYLGEKTGCKGFYLNYVIRKEIYSPYK